MPPRKAPELADRRLGPRAHGLSREVRGEVLVQGVDRRVATLGIGLERLHDDRVEVARERCAFGRGRRGARRRRRAVIAQVACEKPRREPAHLVARVRKPPGEEEVEDRAERPEVGADVDRRRTRLRLLGAHEFGRSDRAAERLRAQRVDPGRVGVERAREAPVDDADPPAALDRLGEDVARLQVAMEDAAPVRVAHAREHLAEERDALADAERRLSGGGRQRLADDDGHREVGPAVGGRAGVGDRDDRGMVEGRERGALGLEAAERVRRGELGAQHLHRDEARGHRLGRGEVDDAVSTLAEFGDQPEPRDDRDVAGAEGVAERVVDRRRARRGARVGRRVLGGVIRARTHAVPGAGAKPTRSLGRARRPRHERRRARHLEHPREHRRKRRRHALFGEPRVARRRRDLRERLEEFGE